MAPGPAQHVTFLHGLGGSPLSWENVVSALPPSLPAHAPWLRGLRPGGRERFSLGDAAAEVLQHRLLGGVETGALVGHSLGAMVALQCAVDDPGSVSHLVLVAGQVRPPRAVLALQRLALGLVPAGRLARQGLSKTALLSTLREAGGADARGALGGIACPTLVVCGARDRANLPASRLIAASVPGAVLEVVPGAGHDVMADAPAAFNAVLYAFLGQAAPGDDVGTTGGAT